MDIYVLDSFALLAYFGGEPGADDVERLLETAREGKCQLVMSVVNLGEVFYITQRERGLEAAKEAIATIRALPIKVINVGRQHALDAARLKAQVAISYADCYVAALALRLGGTIVSGDPEFEKFSAQVPIKWLRHHR